MSNMNPNTYTYCPYCANRLNDSTEEVKRNMAGHINAKHKDKPRIETGEDFVVEIPNKLPPGTAVEIDGEIAVVIPEKNKSLEEPSNKVLKPKVKTKKLTKKQLLKIELEEKLKALNEQPENNQK